jgi:hypothetical protein
LENLAPSPVAAAAVVVTESIDLRPQKGVGAWLHHVFAKRRRGTAMQTLREVLF